MYNDPSKWKIVARSEESLKEHLFRHLANYRYQKEVGGISLGGLPVATDDRTKVLLVGAYNDAVYENDPDRLRQFKVEGNFATLNNAAIIGIALEVATHVQKCFDAEADVFTQIQNDELLTTGEVEAAFDESYSG